MTRVLLTGGSGFIAAHILDYLLQRNHSVVVTVRSQEKADKIKAAYNSLDRSKLNFAIVPDIAQQGAFEKAVISDPPFEAVIHTASPFHFNTTDVQKDLLDPAIIGTTGILDSIKRHAPSVKRVIVTSSFAAMVDGSKGYWPDHVYSEADWNPITKEEAPQNAANGYRASKTFAERAAWKFMEEQRPAFTLTTMCPPLVFGPVLHALENLNALNTSNQRIRDIIQGQDQSQAPSGLWVDVRDLALGHVLAMEREAAADRRIFFTAGLFSTAEIAEIVRRNFPDIKDKIHSKNIQDGALPKDKLYQVNVGRANEILGVQWTSLEKSVVDTVESLNAVGV